MKYTVSELMNMVKVEAVKMPNKDVENIANEIIDGIGEDEFLNLERFWDVLACKSYTYVDPLSGNRYFFG